MVRVVLIGNVPPQTTAASEALSRAHVPFLHIDSVDEYVLVPATTPDLVIVAGWRKIVPPDILAVPRYGTVGFHSAKLPDYPGRAPVPWTLVRGDEFAYNTMLYLDEGVDTGDVIDERQIRVYPSDTPEVLYYHMARTLGELLAKHLPALLDGTAPRTPQDFSGSGPLTSADGWNQWHELQRLMAGHG